MNKRNYKVIIVIFLLIILVVGATYAYFSVDISNTFGSKSLTAKAGKLGSVTLNGTETTLSLNLSASDMMQKGDDIIYYATTDGTPSISPNILSFGSTNVVGDNIFNCSYTLNITSSGDMYNKFQSMDNKSDNQIVLKINEREYDFNTENLFNITYNGVMDDVSSFNNNTINASLFIKNSNLLNQTDLAGTSIHLTLTVTDFNCSVSESSNSGIKILTSNNRNISNKLVGGLYRYQGTKDVVNNNYVCFFSNSTKDCILLRIIGITPDGRLKVITDSSVSSSIYSSDSDSYYSSNVRLLLNNELSNYEVNEDDNYWLNMMDNTYWKYGTISLESLDEYDFDIMNFNDFASEAYRVENNFSYGNKDKFGMMYIHDYLYSLGNFNGNTYSGLQELHNSWLYNGEEWLITGAGLIDEDTTGAWSILDDGTSMPDVISEEKGARPVFYLKNNIVLSNASGTIDDPYIITSGEIGDKYYTYDESNCITNIDFYYCDSKKVNNYTLLNKKYFVKENSNRSINELCTIYNGSSYCINTVDSMNSQISNLVSNGFRMLDETSGTFDNEIIFKVLTEGIAVYSNNDKKGCLLGSNESFCTNLTILD